MLENYSGTCLEVVPTARANIGKYLGKALGELWWILEDKVYMAKGVENRVGAERGSEVGSKDVQPTVG